MLYTHFILYTHSICNILLIHLAEELVCSTNTLFNVQQNPLSCVEDTDQLTTTAFLTICCNCLTLCICAAKTEDQTCPGCFRQPTLQLLACVAWPYQELTCQQLLLQRQQS